MNRIILRLLNAPALILLTVLGIAVQTSLFSSFIKIGPIRFLQPDIVLVVVIWCALNRGFIEGGILTLAVADIAELHSAAPQGMFLIAYMIIYLLVRASSRLLVIPNMNATVTLTLIASVIWKILVLILLKLLGESGQFWRHTLLYLAPGTLVEGALAYWAYQWFEKFDTLTFKSARGERNWEEEASLELI